MYTSGIVGFFVTRIPNAHHLFLRTHRYNKASSTNVLHSILRLSIRRELPMKTRTKTSGTTKCWSQHSHRKQKSEKSFRRTKQQKCYGHRYLLLIRRTRVHQDHLMKTKEQPKRSSKQARTAKKGVEARQEVSYMFQKGHCEHQRSGFLQVRMARMRKSNKKKVLKQKDGERNLHA